MRRGQLLCKMDNDLSDQLKSFKTGLHKALGLPQKRHHREETLDVTQDSSLTEYGADISKIGMIYLYAHRRNRYTVLVH